MITSEQFAYILFFAVFGLVMVGSIVCIIADMIRYSYEHIKNPKFRIVKVYENNIIDPPGNMVFYKIQTKTILGFWMDLEPGYYAFEKTAEKRINEILYNLSKEYEVTEEFGNDNKYLVKKKSEIHTNLKFGTVKEGHKNVYLELSEQDLIDRGGAYERIENTYKIYKKFLWTYKKCKTFGSFEKTKHYLAKKYKKTVEEPI